MSQLKVNSIIPTSGVASGQGGGIIQTITAHKTNTFSHNTSAFTDITGLSLDITPVAPSSKFNINISLCVGGETNSFPAFRLRRNGTTNITLGTDGAVGTNVTFGHRIVHNTDVHQLGYTFIDTPTYSVGDTLTYNIRVASLHSSLNVKINRLENNVTATYAQYGTSTITVQEVAT